MLGEWDTAGASLSGKGAGGFPRGLFCALFLGLCGGMACGAFCAGRLSLLSQGRALPLLFSGIPVPGYGFLSCFTTLLLNLSLWLCLLFLSSLSLAGLGLIPLLLLSKGFLLGLGTLVLLEAEPLWGPAVWFAPAAAGSSLVLLLYGLSAFRFSCRLLRACRSPEGAPLCLRRQCKDLLLFLGLGAGISLTGAGVCFLWDVLI